MEQELRERNVLALIKNIKLVISLFLFIRVVINSGEVINKVVRVKSAFTLYFLYVCYYHL